MSFEDETPDLSGLVPPTPTETPEQARDALIEKVMERQQALAAQFSKIDHPFVTEDAQDDYQLATEEFRALVKCAVHMPESVEGVRFLQEWYNKRLGQVDLLLTHAKPGNTVVFGEGSEPYVMTPDFAKGMRATLLVMQSFFTAFPLELTTSAEEPDDDLEDDPDE